MFTTWFMPDIQRVAAIRGIDKLTVIQTARKIRNTDISSIVEVRRIQPITYTK